MFSIDLPFLHRGILWYGFLFALGFFVGYWIFLYLLRRYFLFFPKFRKEDIASFSECIRYLKNEPAFKLSKELCVFKVGEAVTPVMQNEILNVLNAFIDDSNHPEILKKRLYLEKRFPCLISLKKRSVQIAEKVTVYVVVGALIGARLGDVLFYQKWTEITSHPLSIFKIWEGGLASHGAVVGIALSLWILSKKLRFSFLRLVDLCVIPTALAGLFIRVGNFINQEILGIPTQLPWGVVFGHPLGVASGPVVRHPVQLYEAAWYGLVFLFLLHYFKKHPALEKPGRITGLFFVAVFGFRFLIEFLKEEQSPLFQGHALLTMGQFLSIPFILLGIFLFVRKLKAEQ